ncbi:HPP family protein [Paraburkholderia sp. UCT31]|uniref:HPP family protein n=1 Tax=Paraburkholderia sp. UCT31 TaxID=2615209 RepID=UPI001655C12A|nr:HPP family protein [Paraburkholderia sp. UCT31]
MSRSPALGWLASFLPAPVTVKWHERARSCLGALLGIAFTGGLMYLLLGPVANIPLLVAPMGASAVLLFAVPASPLAQPWSIIGGNLVSATVGVTCAMLIGDPTLAAALAVALSISGMFALRCVHPPSGAVALTAVLGGPVIHALGYRFVLEPIAIQSAALLFAALVYHAATGHRYPHAGRQDRATPSQAADEAARVGFTREDVKAVLGRRDALLDIDTDDLYSLLRETQLQAFSRSFNELRCEDVMSRHVVSVSPGTRAAATDPITELVPMFANFGHHHIPVLDRAGRVVGMITQVDLISGLYRQTPTRAREAA